MASDGHLNGARNRNMDGRNRVVLRFAAVCCLAALSGCASPQGAAGNESSSSLTVSVPHGEKVDVSSCRGNAAAINLLLSARAEAFADMIGNGSVWYGEGLSMEPLLQPGSWLVTKPEPFENLKPGMVVLYTTSEGKPVAHALLRRTSGGWLVAGVNNRRVDPERVTPSNFAGVIAAVFAPRP